MSTTDTAAINTVIGDVIQEAPKIIEDVSTGNFPGAVREVGTAISEITPFIPTIFQEAKAGYKTTEFWLTLASVALTQAGALDLPAHWGKIVVTAGVIVAYILSRGLAKNGAANQVRLK